MANNAMQSNSILLSMSNMLKKQKDAFVAISEAYPLYVKEYKAFGLKETLKGKGAAKLLTSGKGEPEIVFYENETLWLPVGLKFKANSEYNIVVASKTLVVTISDNQDENPNRFFQVKPIIGKENGRSSVNNLIKKVLSEVSENQNLNNLLSDEANCKNGIKVVEAGNLIPTAGEGQLGMDSIFWFVPEIADKVKSKMFFVFNIYEIQKQMNACNTLRNYPADYLSNNLNWLGKYEEVNNYLQNGRWNEQNIVTEWETLKKADNEENNEAAKQQREFVQMALSTPDVAILEGPPGSGKTTVIVELILQLVKQGKRVLLTSATHVAIDNVLEKLYDVQYKDKSKTKWAKEILAVRIASSIGKVQNNDVLRKYHVDSVLSRLLDEAKNHLKDESGLTTGQLSLRSIANTTHTKGNTTKEVNKEFKHFILNQANLVAGTLVGLLQHESLKSEQPDFEPFDYIIVDEASKVTLPGFLVPAKFAKKWILVGDTKQLAPYAEDSLLENHLLSKYDISLKQAEEITKLLTEAYAYRSSRDANEKVQLLMNELNHLNIDKNELLEYARFSLPSVLELFQEGLPEWLRSATTNNPLLQPNGVKDISCLASFNEKNHWDTLFKSLSYQWRMVDELAMIPRKHFYEGKNMLTLKVKEPKYLNLIPGNEDNRPLAFVKTEMHKGNDTQCRNEVESVCKTLKSISKSLGKTKDAPTVLVITFYSKQEKLITKAVNRIIGSLNFKVQIKTVDSVQGKEADIVLLCFTKASNKAFYNVPNRLNVALTRAKYRLFLFGDPEMLERKCENKAILDLCKHSNKISL